MLFCVILLYVHSFAPLYSSWFCFISLFLIFVLYEAMPDFARVYSFIGNIFDPSKRGHLQKLMEMDPIDVETVCHLSTYI